MSETNNSGPVLITGISGFIAGNLARVLARGGAEVVGTGRTPPDPDTAACCAFRMLDVRDYDSVQRVIGEARPKTVYHLAALSVLSAAIADGPRLMLDTNVAGTWNVLEACRRSKVAAVVVASSDKQYGALAAPPYDDNDSTAFLNGGLYELSKAQQDQTARLYAGMYETPAVRVARLVNVYGPGDRQWTRIVPGNIRRTFVGEKPRLTSGPAGAALREYLYVDDAVCALRGLASDAHERGNTPEHRADGKLARVAYNLSSGHKMAAGDAIDAIQRVMRDDFGIEGLQPEILPGPVGVFEPGSQFTDGARIRELLPGYAPRGFVDGLRLTVPWYLTEFST